LLTRNHRQEALCRAYVQAIAARCGMSFSLPQTDYGIDLTLNDIEIAGGHRSESGTKLDVQAKSTTESSERAGNVYYDLEATAYDMLRRIVRGPHRILVVLLLPRDEQMWTTQTEEQLILRRCAFWLSLRGQAALQNRRSVRVQIPRAKVFSVEALRAIMNRIKAGEDP
jgi:hypothetical protein